MCVRGGRAPWGFFHFFGSGTRVFSKDFYRQFLDFSENTLPPCRNMFSVFPFRGGFFGLFRVFRAFTLTVTGSFQKKMGKFLADTRFGHYHQRVA